MSNTWFISDPHFGHKNIIKYEPEFRLFKDTDDMDETIIKNYNDTVGDEDLVFWLGDMFFTKSERTEYIASRLQKGRKILILGNHDHYSPTKYRRLGFEPHRMYMYKDHLLTHEPVSSENMKNLAHYGIRNIHGHVHSATQGFDPRFYQCVSVECINHKPIEWHALMGRFAGARYEHDKKTGNIASF